VSMNEKIRRLVIINEVYRFYVYGDDSRHVVQLAMCSFLSIYPNSIIKDIKLMGVSSDNVLEKKVLHHRIF